MKQWTVDDVMTKTVVSVGEAASYRSVVDTLIEHRISAVPVIDEFRRVRGVVSEADLLRQVEYAGDEEPRLFDGRRRRGERRKALARTAEGLMSTPAVTVPSGTSIAAAARKLDAEKVKRLPVVDDLGRLAGVVTRSDLLKVHLRPDDDIRADVDGVLGGLLGVLGKRIIVAVTDGSVVLDGEVQVWSTAHQAVRLTRQVPGVVEVHDRISFSVDDRDDYHTGIAFGAA